MKPPKRTPLKPLQKEELHGWRLRLHEVVFEADTRAGRLFDLLLILAILLSVAAVLLDSVRQVRERWGAWLYGVEWFFTALFTLEYLLRLIAVRRPLRYAVSFFGLVDLLAILPTFASLIVPGMQYLLAVRVLRILRVFRVLKLVPYLGEADLLMRALWASRRKVTVFFSVVLTLVIILGSLMYLVEGEAHGFTSIPLSIYWAIVTLTTVGYGDISPQTPLGRAVASLVMIIGYAILAVPTGIVTVELAQAMKVSTQACPDCGRDGHEHDAHHCKYCGAKL